MTEQIGVFIPEGYYVSAAQAAEIADVSKDAIIKRITRGRLLARDADGFYLIDINDLQNFVDQRKRADR